MSTPLTSAPTIKTAWLLDWYMSDVDHWFVTTAPFNITYNGQVYQSSPLPTSVGRLQENVKVGDNTMSVVFGVVDSSFKQLALGTNLTGRPFNVYRVYFNDDYSILQIVQRYAGLITVVEFEDNVPSQLADNSEATFSVMFQLKSLKEILKNRVAGRFTNSADMQRFFPTDTSMDYVPAEADREIILGRGT